MNIVGRAEEILEFDRIYRSDKSEFVTVYGRRRVGKTFLIKEYNSHQFSFYITGLKKGNLQIQIDNFYDTLLTNFKLKKNESRATDWIGAFNHLKNYLSKINKKKKVVFFDELPWLATSHSDFMVALEHFWNQWASGRKDIILIVCGSAASWMIKNILKDKGGLHNRVTRRVKLLPFTLKECQLYFKKRKFNWTQYEIARVYMCLGGIPFYLSLLEPEWSVAQNIDRLCFKENGILRGEFNELYESLFKNASNHLKIVKTLGSKQKGLNRLDIIKATKLADAGSTTRILEELEECGFINKYFTYGKLKRDAVYQLTDYFSLFHLKFIANSSSLDKNYWMNKIDIPAQRVWSGHTFELLCLHHIDQIKAKLSIAGIETTSSVWQNSDAQIDLLIDRRDNVVTLCEAKFSVGKYLIDKKYFENLQNKISSLRKITPNSKSIQLAFISTFGLENSKYNTALSQQNIVLEDLFM
jgi:uncharacterized protein